VGTGALGTGALGTTVGVGADEVIDAGAVGAAGGPLVAGELDGVVGGTFDGPATDVSGDAAAEGVCDGPDPLGESDPLGVSRAAPSLLSPWLAQANASPRASRQLVRLSAMFTTGLLLDGTHGAQDNEPASRAIS
jgi:hypothetical protein